MTEAEWLAQVASIARLCGWRWSHQRPARTARGWRTAIQGGPGFPDLVLVRRGRLVFAELKAQGGRLGPGQREWLDDLRACGVEVYVWTPRDLAQVLDVLDPERMIARPKECPHA